MVLAAGLGTRLRPFTERIPKPLIPLHGVPCMEFALIGMKAAGIQETVVNVHAHPALMRSYLEECNRSGIRVRESDETGLLLGSAGGLRKGLGALAGGPFISMNGDGVHLIDLATVNDAHQKLRESRGVSMTLVLARGQALKGQTGMYREILTDAPYKQSNQEQNGAQTGLIVGFGHKKSGVPFFTGTAIFEPEALEHLAPGAPAEFVPEVLEPALRAGKAGFFYSEAPWLDIGSPELWFRAERTMREWLRDGVLPAEIEARVKGADPTFGGRFELGKNTIRMDDIVHEIEDIRDP
jgi:mannose-1-phosphate guanylyltransferase